MNVFARIWSSLGRLASAFDALADTVEAVSGSLRERTGLPAPPATVPQLPAATVVDRDATAGVGGNGHTVGELVGATARQRRGRVSKP